MKRTTLPLIRDCSGCGACCTGQAALPVSWYMAPQPMGNPARLPAELRAELQALLDRFMATGFPPDGSHCIWYDAQTHRCRHYEHRPQLCRDGVQVGDEACRRWRRALGIDPQPRYRMVGGRLAKRQDVTR